MTDALVTIVFVDDEPDAIAALKRAMHVNRPVWRVLTAGGAQDAVALVTANLVSVVVTDMNMKGHDGLDLLDYLRSYRPAIGRIALTGMLDGPSFLSPGTKIAHHYLIKPCPIDRLIAAIEERLAAARATQPPQPRS